MNKILTTLIISAFVFATPFAQVDAAKAVQKPAGKTSAQKQAMIRQSVAAYKGNCPCPWSTNRAGRSCGKTSAWSKPGGAQPLCYESDIR